MPLPDDAAWVAKRATEKAAQYPLEATFLADPGVFSVPSYSRPGAAYQVRPEVREAPTAKGQLPVRVIYLSCSCRAGEYRIDYPVPCYHAAIAGRAMEALVPAVVFRLSNGFYAPRPHLTEAS